MAYFVTFHFGAKRRRDMPFLPRVGDIIDLYDSHGIEPDENNPEFVRLRIDDFHASEDKSGEWEYWMNCTVLKR